MVQVTVKEVNEHVDAIEGKLDQQHAGFNTSLHNLSNEVKAITDTTHNDQLTQLNKSVNSLVAFFTNPASVQVPTNVPTIVPTNLTTSQDGELRQEGPQVPFVFPQGVTQVQGVQLQGRTLRIDFPQFDGKNPEDWVFRVEQYQQVHGLHAAQLVPIASIHLTGDAVAWYWWMRHSIGPMTWSNFLMHFVFVLGIAKI
ncbi:hypothetical protein IFM89_012313 [Coptis chinensis]|uniref:Uncharacterized protein n=1 Tax=Coptis chinensis TaxID=261450 RepID=A0A835HE36_9MAGN|nr:hypothetical protein IFM89_012313 [Coptis chinensis]